MLINPQMTSMYDGSPSMTAMMMMMVMMYRSAAAAAAVRCVAPSLAVDWTQLLTATAPLTTAGHGTVPTLSCPAVASENLCPRAVTHDIPSSSS